MLAAGLRICQIVRPNLISAVSRFQCVRNSSGGDDGKTTINILNSEPDAPLMVDSYSQIGFRLNNGLSVMGPLIIFPKTVLSWNVGGPEDITTESLSLFFVLEPKIDILVIGLGERGHKLNPKVVTELRRFGTNVEMLSTDSACATFNFLNSEKRSVAAALIPPQKLRLTEYEIVREQVKRRKLDQWSDD